MLLPSNGGKSEKKAPAGYHNEFWVPNGLVHRHLLDGHSRIFLHVCGCAGGSILRCAGAIFLN